jgi:8-oxo-dGTP pyrophosphatase MutT (NUDIX family)
MFKREPLAGQNYWVTPSGALEAGENFVDVGRRELFEETGILRDAVGQEVAEREFMLQLHDGD